ncbi:multiple sugar transport system permease protein [Caldanaerobius fijiensis DSM 17918]|uniref:Multiple sugar transport system permease protein n=1 Tax=Caldanaerobius fijiensis DSM 17918 TaxID=1121256 RepID=A0A1M5DAQ5_9THEO|nr:sugar ABC transporter permease [Caldanaerobius fijiensis]SHF64086.1 multiple sugar transport system permease protein [Caldanaerobius fijiensis DSM 17918]
MTARQKKDMIAAYLFLLPNIIGFFAFTVGPVIASLLLSFFNWPVLNPPTFVGFKNYIDLVKDPMFKKALFNTLEYVVGYLPLNIIVSLLLGLWLSKDVKGIALYRTLFFLPVLSPGVAVASIWRWIYQPDYGLFNGLLKSIGINGPNWLGDTKVAMFSVILMSVWWGVGYNTVIFMAGIKAIPHTLYEAAEIDGANGIGKFFKITIPLLSPTLFFGIVMTLITSFQVFDQIYIMTNGGPMNATTTLVMYIFQNGFQFFKMGYAAAMSWILFMIIFILTLIQLRLQKNWVTYDI